MTHAYHEGLPRYVEGAIFQDGCGECEARAGAFMLGHMDRKTWAHARERALELHRVGLERVSSCEARVLLGIAAVLLKEMEYRESRDREMIARHLRTAASAVNVNDWPAYLQQVADGHAAGTSWYMP